MHIPLKVVTYPNPILEQKSAKVTLPLTKEEEDIVRHMYEVVQGQGIGLAAPQVGVSKQLLLVNLSSDPELAKTSRYPDMLVINPEITFFSQMESLMVEGCLSFPGEYWEIWRPANITAEFVIMANFVDWIKDPVITPIYKKHQMKAKEWMSRVLQHEFDHLDGKLFIKRGGRKLHQSELEGVAYTH